MFLPLILTLSITVQALYSQLQVRPQTTNTISTLYLTLEPDLSLPWKPIAIKLKSPSRLPALMPCSVITPLYQVITCQSNPTLQEITINFSQALSEVVQIEISNFLTPFTTSYTGFTVTTLDTQGYTLQSLKDLKLTALVPSPLPAEVKSQSTRISEQTTFTVALRSSLQCDTCELELQGAGLDLVQCPTCSLVSGGVILKKGLLFGQSYTFQLINAQNPTNFTAVQYRLIVREGGSIAYQSSYEITASDTALISNLAAQIQGASEIGKISGVVLNFTLPVQLDAGCALDVLVPGDYTDLKEFMWKVSVDGAFSQQSSQRSLQFQVLDDGLIQIKDACLTTIKPGQVSLTLSFMRNPTTVRATESFKVTILDAFGVPVCRSTQRVAVSGFTPGTIRSFKLSFSNSTVQSPTSATFEILPSNKLPPTATMLIKMPTAFVLGKTPTCTSLNIVATKQSFACTAELNTLKLSDFVYSVGYDPLTDRSIKVQVQNIGLMPDSVQELAVQVTTFATLDEPVDNSTFILQGHVTPGTIDTSYLFSNDQTSQLSNLTMNLTLRSRLTALGAIKLTMPADIQMPTSLQCVALRGFSGPCNISSDLVIPIGARSQDFNITFRLINVRLPRYQGQISQPLKIETIAQDGKTIDTDLLGLFVSKAQEIRQISLESGSFQNSAKTWLTIQLTIPQSVSHALTDTLVISLPTELKLLNETCKTIGSCLIANNTVKVTDFSPSDKIVSVNVTIVNQESVKPVTGFQIRLVDQTDRLLATAMTGLEYTTSEPAILSVSLAQLSTKQLEKTRYTFTADREFGMVTITLPDCMQLGQSTLTDKQGQMIAFTYVGQNKLKFTASLNSVNLENIENPSKTCLNRKITLETHDSQGFIRGSIQLTPSQDCDNSCKSCSSDDHTLCTACLVPLVLLAGKCVERCPSQSFSDINQICTLCPQGCLECSDSQKCSRCTEQNVLDEKGQCVPAEQCTARQSHFIADDKCLTCQKPCLDCTLSGQCLRCDPFTYLHEGQCVETCDDSMSVNGNICSVQTIPEIMLSTFLDLPCTYLYVVWLIVSLIWKCIKKTKTQFVMTNLVVCATMMMPLQFYVIYTMITSLYDQKIWLTISLCLLVPIFIQMGSNLVMTILHHHSMGVGDFPFPNLRKLVYVPSLLATFHTLTLVPIPQSKKPLSQKPVEVLDRYLKVYTTFAQFVVYASLLPMFGVMDYQAVMNSQPALLTLDLAFMIAMTGFWMQIALYYPPEDILVRKQLGMEIEENLDMQKLAVAKNSVSVVFARSTSEYQLKKFKSNSKRPQHIQSGSISSQVELTDLDQSSSTSHSSMYPSLCTSELDYKSQLDEQQQPSPDTASHDSNEQSPTKTKVVSFKLDTQQKVSHKPHIQEDDQVSDNNDDVQSQTRDEPVEVLPQKLQSLSANKSKPRSLF